MQRDMTSNGFRTAAALLLAPLAIACAGDAGEDAEGGAEGAAEAPATAETAASPEGVITDLREITFADELAVDLDAMEETESGLFIQVLQEGSGPPAGYGDEMHVHYTLWLPNGSTVDSSHDRDEPLELVLGSTPLIDGWVEGVTGMRLGERRRLVLPYDLGYGEMGNAPRIPGYSPLVFEVELVEHIPTGEG
ncbi:FKBP-type peptidyl-prolyl cis-trans isomerase [Candidatus Palauibacter soopunensis]|uniref:FKBP-type peptidyl-prolyl cis-trans isomerase n=1 Tax=Candidatus Palauibacter soopunensis TaxID=3056739 RepID=UPI0023855F84|nr:FKBP-type peptidyl-prolyl cis-trans isomerase [Candidatus Palauibacter soopunensis]MDE2879555.1 FKBP-type peptidyl-prolyl cis-trans isomerase [Candidatus Palauibacter soopunensis]